VPLIPEKLSYKFPKPHKFADGFHQSGCLYTNPNLLPKIGVNSKAKATLPSLHITVDWAAV